MSFAVYNTVLGKMRIEYEEDKVTAIKKADDNLEDYGKQNNFTDCVINQLEEYFSGNIKTFDFSYKMKGTDFQKKVWNALLDIPYGEVRTYKEVAKAIGNEKASRAVGLANNKNPMMVVVPCHRVIGANGKLVGYAGGLGMKEYLIEMEKKHK